VTILFDTSFIDAIVLVFVAPISCPLRVMDSVRDTVNVDAVTVLAIILFMFHGMKDPLYWGPFYL
jgi:hypothetical protein